MQERKQVLSFELKPDNVVSGLQYIQSVLSFFIPFLLHKEAPLKLEITFWSFLRINLFLHLYSFCYLL